MLSIEKYSNFLQAQKAFPEYSELIGKLLSIAFINKGSFPKFFYIAGEYTSNSIFSVMIFLGIEVDWCSVCENFKYFRKATYVCLNISEDCKEL